jgi:hypothetical protein
MVRRETYKVDGASPGTATNPNPDARTLRLCSTPSEKRCHPLMMLSRTGKPMLRTRKLKSSMALSTSAVASTIIEVAHMKAIRARRRYHVW